MSYRRKQQIIRALKSAARVGFDPYDSHPTQERKWNRAWKDEQRRRSERDANRELAAQLEH